MKVDQDVVSRLRSREVFLRGVLEKQYTELGRALTVHGEDSNVFKKARDAARESRESISGVLNALDLIDKLCTYTVPGTEEQCSTS